MKVIRRTSHFKKDVNRMERRGMEFTNFKQIITELAFGQELEKKYSDHSLEGQYSGLRECHIKPDWLLIYESNEDEIILIRTGSHSDLFSK